MKMTNETRQSQACLSYALQGGIIQMMKPRLLLIALLFVLCATQAGARTPKVEKTPAQKLIERLTKLG